MADAQVLIVGAGPTGLVLALWLTQQGVSVRIIDKAAQAGTYSRALAVHARTLELYRQLDLDVPIVEQGYTVPGARLWLRGTEKARIPFEQLVSDLTPYGFLHIFPQDEHERLLTDSLRAHGVEVERATELIQFTELGGGIRAQLRHADGSESEVAAAYIAGCDGARSTVREQVHAGFPGGTYAQLFYVADIEGSGAAFNGDLNIELDESDFLAVFPLAHAGRVRLIGAIRPHEHTDLDKLTFDDIKDRAVSSLQLKVAKVHWFSVYHVHHRVTDSFRHGRAFLLGDAAHIHTPVGGQGMNTGIGDAINLAWKLHAVLSGAASDALLDSYDAERRAFALRLVQTTDRLFNFVASDGPLAELVRQRVAPLVLPLAVKSEHVRETIFRTVSQITLNYRGKGLDAGLAGAVHGGDRLPWVRVGASDNYATLKQMCWQIHVYGRVPDALPAWCDGHGIDLHAFVWTAAYAEAGLVENALYLVRPDTYVALASSEAEIAALEAYFRERNFTLSG